MNQFKIQLSKKMNNQSAPIMVIFTHPDLKYTTLYNVSKFMDMSIPESFLSLSNDVLIIIQDGVHIRTLMSKGVFSQHFPAPALDESMLILDKLPTPYFHKLENVFVDSGLPSNLIKLNHRSDYFDLNLLSQLPEIEINECMLILKQLFERAMLPKLNKEVINKTLDTIIKKLEHCPELNELYKELCLIAGSGKAGTPEHKNLIAKYDSVRKKHKTSDLSAKLNALHNYKQLIYEYFGNSTKFAYGSNRAMNANTIKKSELEIFGKCMQ